MIFKDFDMVRIPIRFWLATVLASKPGEVDPVVHEILYHCGGVGSHFYAGDPKFFQLVFEENGGDSYSVEALLVSELKAMTKNVERWKCDRWQRMGFGALLNLNMMMFASHPARQIDVARTDPTETAAPIIDVVIRPAC